MTDKQARVLGEHHGITVIATCAQRSKSLIVKFAGDPRFWYLTPGGYFRRCR